MSIYSTVGVRELRQDASKLLKRVQEGECIEITDHGKPVALLTPVNDSPWESALEAGLIHAPASSEDWRDIEPAKWRGPKSMSEILFEDRQSE